MPARMCLTHAYTHVHTHAHTHVFHTSMRRYDRDKGGVLDAAEFKKAVRLGMKIPPDQLADADLVRADMHRHVRRHMPRTVEMLLLARGRAMS